MRPDPSARPEYLVAFREIVKRIEATLTGAPRRSLPLGMFVAGGAAMHLYTGERMSEDIDATFTSRILLPEDLEVAYRDVDGAARVLYFDRQYNDSFALMHEDARDDSRPLSLEGVDPAVVDVRLLSPVDLAVSKIARLAEHDRGDITALARRGLVTAKAVRQRAEQAMAMGGYVGDLDRLRKSIEIAVRIIEEAERGAKGGERGRRGVGAKRSS